MLLDALLVLGAALGLLAICAIVHDFMRPVRMRPIQRHIKLDTHEIGIVYDELRDVIEIEGNRYAGQMFRAFGGWPINTIVQIVSRDDGVIYIEKAPFNPCELKVFPMEVVSISTNERIQTPLIKVHPIHAGEAQAPQTAVEFSIQQFKAEAARQRQFKAEQERYVGAAMIQQATLQAQYHRAKQMFFDASMAPPAKKSPDEG